MQIKNTTRDKFITDINTDLGTGAKLKIYTSAYGTLLATWTWTGNVWATPASGQAAMNAPSAATVSGAAQGTAAIGKFTTSADSDIVKDLTVATSAADIPIDNTSINAGQNVVLNYAAATLTSPNAGF